MHHRHLTVRKTRADRLEAQLERLQVQLLRFFDDRIDDVDLRAGRDLVIDEFVDALELCAGAHCGFDRLPAGRQFVDH